VRSVDGSYKRVEDLVDRDAFDAEVQGLVEWSGALFTPELAAAMVVDRLGRSEFKVPTLDRVRPGATSVVRGFVARIGEVRQFEREGMTSRVANVVLRDSTGQITLVLWDGHSGLVERGVLQEGKWVRAANVTVRKTDYGVEAQAGRYSTVTPEDETTALEQDREVALEVEWAPLDALAEGQMASVRGEVVSKRGPRRFRRRDGSQSSVLNITVFDGRAMAIVVLWDDLANRHGDVEAGATVELLHGLVKVNRGAVEVHSRRESIFRTAD
jgi:ssDNA-binding replication factor A large subunit